MTVEKIKEGIELVKKLESVQNELEFIREGEINEINVKAPNGNRRYGVYQLASRAKEANVDNENYIRMAFKFLGDSLIQYLETIEKGLQEQINNLK